MNTELTTATANRINELHQTVLDSVKGATDSVNAAMMASVEIGGHLEQISKGQRIAWCRDNCPQLSHKQIAAYLGISATYRRRPENTIDNRFFTLLGMTSDDEEDHENNRNNKHEPNPYAWVKLAGKLRSLLTTDHIKTMDRSEKETARLHLKPMVDLYNALL